LQDAEHCRVEDCLFHAVGGNAVYLEGYNARNTIRHNEISFAGANGVCLMGGTRRYAVPKFLYDLVRSKGPWLGYREPYPMFNEVVDNYIHDCGAINKYVAGVFLGVSNANTIAHNRIENLPHHAVNLGMNGYGRNVVEYNVIRHVCLETMDNGAINMWMEKEQSDERCGHVVRFNWISDVSGCTTDKDGRILRGVTAAKAQGIYLDNNSSNCVIQGNIIVRAGRFALFVHSGKNNLLENNIIVDAGLGQLALATYNALANQLTGNRFCRNIVCYGGPDAFLLHLRTWNDQMLAECDENVYFRRAGGACVVAQFSAESGARTDLPFAEWQKLGYDGNSVLADPLFVDLSGDNYHLRPDSPALKLGFVPIDAAKIGVRGRTLPG
jgi:parallel beta-helix repeat protein